MPGLGAILGGLGAVLTNILPKAFSYFERAQDHKHELEKLEKINQIELDRAKVGADQKIAEADANAMAEHAKASSQIYKEAISYDTRNTGIFWVDALRGSVRPVLTLIVGVVWVLIVVMFMRRAVSLPFDQMQLAFKSVVGLFIIDSVLMVWAFWFVDRTYKKRSDG